MVTKVKAKPPVKRGRRPSDVNADGKPEKTSEYPKLTVSMRPEVKARLDAVSMLMKLPAWKIVEAALDCYVETVPPEDRRLIDGMVSRIGKHPASAPE